MSAPNRADLHIQLHGDSISDVNIRGVRGWDVPTNMVAQHVSLAAQSQNQVDGNYSPSGYCNPIVCTHPQAVYPQK